MTPLMVSLAFGAFALAMTVRIAWMGRRGPAAPVERRSWAALVVVWLLLIGARPHEMFMAGEDHAAYINAAETFARRQTIFYTDELLARVPPAVRPDFLFGHRAYGVTKDNCLRVADVDRAMVGPKFQPLFPVVLSGPARLVRPEAVLYVVPVLALLTALALGRLAGLLLPHPWASAVAPWFYLLMPLTVWHGRAPRAEIAASLCLAGGAALLLHAWRGARWMRWPDLLTGALAVTLAPFFHITAWFVALPLAGLAALASVTGRADFGLHLAAAAAGVAAFVWQTATLTDHYGLLPYLRPVLASNAALAVLLAAPPASLALAAVLANRLAPRWRTAMQTPSAQRVARALPRAVAVTIALTMAALYFRSTPIGERAFAGYQYHYAHPTDMRVVCEYLSLPVALLALAGVCRLFTLRGSGGVERRAWVLAMLPAVCLIGNIYDFFMTRYLMLAVVPLAALGLTAAVTALPPSRRWGTRLFLPAAALTAGLLLAGRLPLLRVVDDKGLLRCLQPLAARVQAVNGIVLGEYTRLIAPFEHLYGIPLLSFDNETRADYRAALRAWETIVRNDPRPAFFLTPFDAPQSDRFTFEHVATASFERDRLVTELYRLPRKVRRADVTLHLYRMRLAAPSAPLLPFVRVPDASNLGLAQFSKPRTRGGSVVGRPIDDGAPLTVRLASDGAAPVSMLAVFGAAGRAEATAVADGNRPLPRQAWQRLPVDTAALTLALPAFRGETNLTLRASGPLLLLDLRAAGAQAADAAPRDLATAPAGDTITSRWTLPTAHFLAPVPRDRAAWLVLFVKAPDEVGDTAQVRLGLENQKRSARDLPTQGWTAAAWPLARLSPEAEWAWFSMRTVPAWKPNDDDYPPELGVRVGWIAVVAAPSSAGEE